MSKRIRKNKGPYVAVPKVILNAPGWRTMTCGARLLWIDLRGWLRNDGLNNGQVHRSCRGAAKSIGVTTQSIVRWFAELEHYGFLRKTSDGFLGNDGRGVAAKYRFTDLPYNTRLPTRDYEKWDGEIFVNSSRRVRRKKQNPVMIISTPRDDNQHIRKTKNREFVCDDGQHIGKPHECDDSQHISRLPLPVLPTRERRKRQGSLTVRAPVQTGGAGSSPAPESNPHTAVVLRMVAKLSPQVRMLALGLKL